MAKAFSVASWNVEHFGKTAKRGEQPKKPIGPVIDYIASQNADIIAIYEVVGKAVYTEILRKMPGYQFHITEGPQAQEILIGVRSSLNAFVTQRTEFRSGQTHLRPGVLLTVRVDEVDYPLLFLHLKSSSTPKGFGLRDDMTARAMSLKKSLDQIHEEFGHSGKANFIFLGDLNTMGMNLTYGDQDISGSQEISRLKRRLSISSLRMKVLGKSHEQTWWPGSNGSYPVGNLDHVAAAEHLQFAPFNGEPVDTRGWVEHADDDDRDAWAAKYSDHALLYFEVQKVQLAGM